MSKISFKKTINKNLIKTSLPLCAQLYYCVMPFAYALHLASFYKGAAQNVQVYHSYHD